ncbi:MAG: endonuclease III domain-containing protein [Thermodesulfobacteriota bacterium]
MIVGAILTQNTAWTNVEKAIKNLKREQVLSPAKMQALEVNKLAALIRPAGYFNVKAKRLKNFLTHLFSNHNASLTKFFKAETNGLRKELLDINGIGPETADSILLYAARRPVFVVDAYTKRILTRHALAGETTSYHQIQAIFTDNLKEDEKLFNEYHALIVRVAKEYCKSRNPQCCNCPLEKFL